MGARRAARLLAAHDPARPRPRRRGRPGGDAGATRRRRDPVGRATRCWLVHGYTDYFFNTELADHFAARGFAFYALDLHKCGRSRREGQTPHFTTDLARYDAELERALDGHRRRDRRREVLRVRAFGGRPDRVAVAGPAARAAVPTERTTRRRSDAQQPVPGSARPGDPALRADDRGADRRWLGVRKRTVVRAPERGRLRHDACTATTPASSTTTWSGSRSAASPSHSAGSTRSAAAQARLHRGLDVGVPNLILRSDHSVREVTDPGIRSSAATRCSTSRRSPGGPAASATAPRSCRSPTPSTTCSSRCRSPRAAAYRELDRWLDATWYLNATPRRLSDRVTAGTLRHRDHRHRFGQQHPRRSLRRQAGGDLRAGHVRRDLPQRRLHPDQDVRLRRRGGRDQSRDARALRRRRAHRRGCAGPTSSRGCSAASIRSASGGEHYRRSSPNVEVFGSHTRFAESSREDGYRLRTDDGDEFTADQVVIAAGARADGPAGDPRLRRRTITPATRSCGSPELPEHMVIVGGGFVAAEFAHVFSVAGLAGDDRAARHARC